jgi:mRNA-degrading endonuclease toxin of MazEF toxin-antitoxin module
VTTAARRLPGDQGSIYWAVVPYAAQQPFHVAQPDGSERVYQSSTDLASAVKQQQEPIDFAIVARAKVRPVLLLQDRPLGRFPEYAALQITSAHNLESAVAHRVRAQEEPALFHLDAGRRRYGMRTDSVIDLQSLVRVRRGALVGRNIGSVDENEFRTICERLVAVSDLDLRNLIVREAGALLERLKGPQADPKARG